MGLVTARLRAAAMGLLALGALSGCGSLGSAGSSGIGSVRGSLPSFRSAAPDPSELQANRYIWNASLDVLSFLPVSSADPRTGVIETGYGTPPGGSQAYRASVRVAPSQDARSLQLALYTRSGAVPAATRQAVEDAILARARQLRLAGSL